MDNNLTPPETKPVTESKKMWKNLLFTFIGTTISILLTFGTSQIVQMHRKAQDRKMTVMMVLGNIEKFARNLDQLSLDLQWRDTMATLLLDIPIDSLDTPKYSPYVENSRYVAALTIINHDKTAEGIFSNSIETWKNMGNFGFIDNVGKCFASMNTIEEDYNNYATSYREIQKRIMMEPDTHKGMTEDSKYLHNQEYRNALTNFHARACYYRYVASFIRYLNKTNMKLMDISEDEVTRFIEKFDNDIEIDAPVPKQFDYLTPELNADSLDISLEWIKNL